MEQFIKTWGPLVALIISFVALAQHWAIRVYMKFFKRGGIGIFETGSVEIGYSSYGPTIGLWGTLAAEDRDFFVRTMGVQLRRCHDGAQHSFEWTAIRSLQISVARPNEGFVEIPGSFMLMRSTPHRYNILFSDARTRDEIRPHLESLRDKWQKHLWSSCEKLPGFDSLPDTELVDLGTKKAKELYPSFADTSPEHTDAYSEVSRRCYWEEGDYELQLEVETCCPSRTFKKSWSIALSSADASRLRVNAISILDEVYAQPPRYNFAIAAYEPLATSLPGKSS